MRLPVSILLIGLMGCAHVREFHPLPHTLANYAVQCVDVRKVVCVSDADMNAAQCNELVPYAVFEINRAIGREVLVYAGVIPGDDAVVRARYAAGDLVVFAAKLPENVLGMTVPAVSLAANGDAACIDRVITVLDVALLNEKRVVAAPVLIHELVHALGFAHAPPGHYGSIMAPAVSSDQASLHLTPADIRSLRDTYGR